MTWPEEGASSQGTYSVEPFLGLTRVLHNNSSGCPGHDCLYSFHWWGPWVSERTRVVKVGWPGRGKDQKPRPKTLAQAPSHCIVGVWLSLWLASLLHFYPPTPPTTKQPPTDTPDSQLSLIPATADQPGWLKSPGATAILNMERRTGCGGSKLLAMAQVSFKEMINYGTPGPKAEHHNSAKIIAQEGKDGVSKILIQSFVLIFKILFCDYFLL